MSGRVRLSFMFILLLALSVLSTPAAATGHALVSCKIDGAGAYVFDPVTHVDYYQWSGEVDGCDVNLREARPEKGVFTGTGYVANLEGHGRGTITIVWENNQRSELSFIVTGIPEALVLEGKVIDGLYKYSAFGMELHCKLKDTQKCFQLGSSAWDFLGTLEILQ